jgi:dTDP-glucose 4,6-dehydratase
MSAADHSGPINIGNPTELSIRQIAEDVIVATGSSSTIEFVERPVDDPEVRRPDASLAASALGWQPAVSWSQGLSDTVDWFTRALDHCADSPHAASARAARIDMAM